MMRIRNKGIKGIKDETDFYSYQKLPDKTIE